MEPRWQLVTLIGTDGAQAPREDMAMGERASQPQQPRAAHWLPTVSLQRTKREVGPRSEGLSHRAGGIVLKAL